MATASTTPPHPPSGASPSDSTPALAPAQSSTKRLSTVKTSPSAGTGAVSGANNAGGGGAKFGAGKDVMSPGELCGFVDTMMSQLETRFDEFSEQMLSRMDDMSNRIDNLENTIQDLMHSDIDELDGKPHAAGSGAAAR